MTAATFATMLTIFVAGYIPGHAIGCLSARRRIERYLGDRLDRIDDRTRGILRNLEGHRRWSDAGPPAPAPGGPRHPAPGPSPAILA